MEMEGFQSLSFIPNCSLQNTPALRAHLWAIRHTDPHIWFAWCGILRGRESFAFKLFQKWILLGDSERGFEPWSPRCQSCTLITSYFGESTSSSARAIPLRINRARDPAWAAGGWGTPSGHAEETEISAWTLSFLVGTFIIALLAVWQQDLSVLFSSTQPKHGQEDFLWIRIRSVFFNQTIPNQLHSYKADMGQTKSCEGILTIPT